MGVLRSAMAILRRGSSGSSAAAYVGGRGLELNQGLRHTASSALPVVPPLHPAATGNFKGCQRFSTGLREPRDNAQGGMRMWWQQTRNRMKYANPEERARFQFVFMLFIMGTPAALLLKKTTKRYFIRQG